VAGLLTSGDVDTEEITRVMSERLSSFKVPREIVLLDKDEIPLLATGKANRLAVREVVAKKTGR
jgi:acyl-CoA synthetase (AMP-forming)/AMP-acid ligase II